MKRWLEARLIERPRWHVPVAGKDCANHPATRAQDRCDRCGRPYCATCLHHVDRWRICGTCTGQLVREWRGPTIGQRLQRALPSVMTGAGVLVLIVVVALLINQLLGSAASDQSLARTAEAIGGKLQAPPNTAKLQLQTSLGPGFPPAEITVKGSGFPADGYVKVVATLQGRTTDGQQVTEQETVDVHGPYNGGLLNAQVHIAGNTRFPGPYHLHVAAAGDQGGSATLDVTAGGPAHP